jgi:hypothetical protein
MPVCCGIAQEKPYGPAQTGGFFYSATSKSAKMLFTVIAINLPAITLPPQYLCIKNTLPAIIQKIRTKRSILFGFNH